MKTTLLKVALAATLSTLATLATTGAANAEVGVSLSIAQPGVYGRVDIGQFPSPVLVSPRPYVASPAVGVGAAPVYLWVPPEHRLDWRRHCAVYGACGVPVYFVEDNWYHEHVIRGHERRVDRRDDRRDDRQDRREDRRDDRQDRREDRRD